MRSANAPVASVNRESQRALDNKWIHTINVAVDIDGYMCRQYATIVLSVSTPALGGRMIPTRQRAPMQFSL